MPSGGFTLQVGKISTLEEAMIFQFRFSQPNSRSANHPVDQGISLLKSLYFRLKNDPKIYETLEARIDLTIIFIGDWPLKRVACSKKIIFRY